MTDISTINLGVVLFWLFMNVWGFIIPSLILWVAAASSARGLMRSLYKLTGFSGL